VFDVAKFIRALEKVVIIAKDPRNAQANPPSYMVHPALVPSEEWKEFDSPSKQAALAAAIKARMQFLWEAAGLMPGIRWETKVDPVNTVDFDFELRENNDPKGGFPRAVTKEQPDGLTKEEADGLAVGQADALGGTDHWREIKAIIEKKGKWNPAELAFRLSQAINPGYRQTITVWPDSLLEEIPPSPINKVILTKDQIVNKVILTKEQIVNAFAKTMVHEIGHSWSLDHPVKTELIAAKTELQKLVLKNVDFPSSETFQLSFHGQTTEPLSFYQEDPKIQEDTQPERRMIKMGSQPISDALLKLSSIGYLNYKGDGKGQGVFVYGCRYVMANTATLLKDFKPPPKDASLTTEQLEKQLEKMREAHNRQREASKRIIDLCTPDSEVPARERTFYFEFANHLGGVDVDPITIIPSGAGDITIVEKGEKTFKVQTKNNEAGAEVRAIIDGYSEADVFSDLMADINDAAGDLTFRKGLSLEPLKMALALNYTKDDVEKVVKLYSAMDKAYTAWGTPRGFE
jgi:hypothetical protein